MSRSAAADPASRLPALCLFASSRRSCATTAATAVDTPTGADTVRSSKGSSGKELRGRRPPIIGEARGDPTNLIQFILA